MRFAVPASPVAARLSVRMLMNPLRMAACLVLFASCSVAFPLPKAAKPSASPGRPQTDLPLVYLTDFELNAVPPIPARLRPPTSPVTQADEEPSAQAARLVKLLTLALTTSLKKAGYSVPPFPSTGARPDKGLLIRGVFTEADEYNRVRRVVLGSGSKSAKFVVYVGVNNLASPEQPLYQLVSPNTSGPPVDTRLGPLITITSYGPVTSFELDRRPSDDSVKNMAADIVAKLSALVAANPQLAK
jgi:hypothetical protein